MLTIPATVCIAGARTKRRLSFASIRIARGCPGPLQGLGMKEHVRPVSLGAAAHRLRGTSAKGCFPLPQRHEPSPGSCSNPNHVWGWFLIPNPPRATPGSSSVVLSSISPLSTRFRRCLSPETNGCPDGSVPVWVPSRDTLL